MIISDRHHFIFVAVPKTGTHSVRQALRRHMGPEDQEQVGLFVQRRLAVPELARLRHGHISLEQARTHLDSARFESYFKFAFVRNPFDRFVSYCAFMSRQGPAFQQRPRDVMRHYLVNPRRDHILFQPQHAFVCDSGGKLLADYVGRVETMQESFDEVCERIGVPAERLELSNSSRRMGYREYYDEELIEGVASLYARDLQMFGYEF